MTDLNFLNSYTVPLIIGVCLCVGYVIKNFITTSAVDKYIPLIMAILGIGLNVWINMTLTPEILLGGMLSGLASTGLHQTFKQILSKE